jgi:hypothetical protein
MLHKELNLAKKATNLRGASSPPGKLGGQTMLQLGNISAAAKSTPKLLEKRTSSKIRSSIALTTDIELDYDTFMAIRKLKKIDKKIKQTVNTICILFIYP